jgi:multicomponent Na+:H+ antiporter subunit D
METMAALVVAVPLLFAALLAAVSHWLPRSVPDIVAIVGAAAVTAMGVMLMLGTRGEPRVVWFAGWHPQHGLPIGIAFVVDPLAAAMVALAGLIALASLIFSWRYFEEVGHLYHSLMLVFVAGMSGFVLSADLFNIFVWLELMSIAAYALCGYQVHQASVIQGAVNFAIINSLGSFAMLLGVAMVYGSTGQLNLSGISHHLTTHGASPPVVVGFALITTGLLVKAGAVPFHFWLSDAYAVASAPVGALLAGVMSDLAYHTFARVYWDGFAAGFQEHAAAAVRGVLVAVAVLTAIVGAVMCWLQSDLKRQIAFLTISHGGVVLAGIALLTPRGLAGATMYLISDGTLKAGLFLSFAVVILRLGSSDELRLRGRGQGAVIPGLLFVTAAIGLGLAPPLGTFLSAALIYDSAGFGWLTPVLAVATAVTAATVMRATGRIYFGWGSAHDPFLTSQRAEEPKEGEPTGGDQLGVRRRSVLLAPAFVLVAVGCGLSFVPGIAGETVAEAHAAQDYHAREALVLHDEASTPPVKHAFQASGAAWGYGIGTTTGAVLLAGAALAWRPDPKEARRRLAPVLAVTRALKGVHDGAVGDYAAWLTLGTALLGVAWALTLLPA